MLLKRTSNAMMLLLVFGVFCTEVNGYPYGAPAGGCETMLPGHGASPQNGPQNYAVNVHPTTYDCKDKWINYTSVTVIVQGTYFKGFLCQARTDHNSYVTSGTLNNTHPTVPATHNCEGEASLTHSNSDDKAGLLFEWTPDFTKTDTVYIVCTIVQSKLIYWVNQTSAAITFAGNGTCDSESAANSHVVSHVTYLIFLTAVIWNLRM